MDLVDDRSKDVGIERGQLVAPFVATAVLNGLDRVDAHVGDSRKARSCLGTLRTQGSGRVPPPSNSFCGRGRGTGMRISTQSPVRSSPGKGTMLRRAAIS